MGFMGLSCGSGGLRFEGEYFWLKMTMEEEDALDLSGGFDGVEDTGMVRCKARAWCCGIQW